MMYKNSFRILFSTANLIWKVMLYFIVVGAVIGGLTYVSALPIINVLGGANFFTNLNDIFVSFFSNLNLSELFVNLREIIKDFVTIISQNINSLMLYIILFIFMLVILGSFLKGLYSAICGGVLYNSMSNNIKQPFISSFRANLVKAIKLELARLTIILPVNVATAVIMYYMFTLTTFGGVMYILAPFLIMLVYVILIALKTTFFAGWMPALFVINAKTYPALFKGFGVIHRRFWNIFATSIALMLTVLTVNLFVGIFTLSVGLLITIPASYMLFVIFEMVSFYMARGIRFYIDSETIFEPKKADLTDKKKDIKYIM